ncbi:hypothetical protein [Sinimarinibacterium sp. NLF-5-8]|uniref:hypothetical protein n=1 Tax=Sinimarinibacterium sp. NLF-5-8 TaxID=2698684 RepID=UPI00137C2A66|nr:hypothetical protein [Sinimarinibacterium sp. NLF-5-8]QHS09699.1 hypothetical protein GT972_05690 [Sinimarinibacterium sp. NLF-5-8]
MMPKLPFLKSSRAEIARGILIPALLLFSPPLWAHSFGRIYTLPVPFWLYAWGGAAALLLSFVVVGWFATAPVSTKTSQGIDLTCFARALRRLHLPAVLQTLALLCLLLCIVSGYIGSRDPYRNINMTLFWVIFILGFAYAVALLGDLYARINPWQTLAQLISRFWHGFAQGRWAYPQKLAYWPALALYMAFIWLELFGFIRPPELSRWLLIYTGINLVAVYAWGARAWFTYGEFFAVFLRLLALMAPVEYVPGQRLALRWPFVGILNQPTPPWSLLIFVLFMLSSTAFDGLRATVPWFKLFWLDPTGLLTLWQGRPPIQAFIELRPWYFAYETLCLLLSPFLYLALYLLFITLTKWCARSPLPVRTLALRFALSLLPIVLVYHFTHYYTLLLNQGIKIVSLSSDPFGKGWDLFGTQMLLRAPILPDLKFVWHTQVGLIVLGHIASVWVAHIEALRLFKTRAAAAWSQIPMLFLMVGFTTFGLWILAQPLQEGR